MAELKTTATDNSVNDFIGGLSDVSKRQDSLVLLDIFTRVTGEPATMWGSSIIGFGQYKYKSANGAQENDWLLTGFSPRKANITLYLSHELNDYASLLDKLGKHKTSKGCLYIVKLSDVDTAVLEELISQSYSVIKQQVK